MTVRLMLFGSPTIVDGSRSIALACERRTQLIVYLALKRGWVGRAELAALLWPDQQNKSAYANLRKTLFRLQSMELPLRIDMQGGALRVDADTDVGAFEAALREQRLADALSFRRGELLAGFDDDSSESWSSWLGFERDRLRVAWRRAALQRLDDGIDADEGIALATQLLEADPLDEVALRAQMSSLARSGQHARARQVYREFTERLARELGLAPAAELQALHDSLGATIAVAMPPAAAASRTTDADFIGRTLELRTLAELLAGDDGRLVCIVGAGGAGKTRLARRAGEQLATRFADGVVFVALDDLTDAGALGSRIARELALAPAGSTEPMAQVIDHLRDRHLLLVLDNFEHLAEEASVLQPLLRQCARLRILATSRVRLGIAAQRLLPLHGLPCPEAEDMDCIEAFDAAQLFIQAARRVDPALQVAAEAASIVDICRQVEGLPLALELAAAWTRVLPCDAIAAELRRDAELLQDTDAAHPARHASIEAVFEQSWRLLNERERDALARLSVFRGGFAAESARAVAASPLPVLAALADKSLLRKDGARLSMHPLVQQLASRRLDDREARASAERLHAHHFHTLLAQSRRAASDGDRDAMLRLDREFDNCRAAWRWSIAHGATSLQMQSSFALLQYCDHRGRPQEGLQLLREALDSRGAGADPALALLLQAQAAHLDYRLDRYAEAEAGAARALAAAQPTRDYDAALQCLTVLGACNLRLGRLEEARRHFTQTLQLDPERLDPHTTAATLDNLALVEKTLGRYDEALQLSTRSLVQHRHLADAAGEALCLNNLGDLCLIRGDHEVAGAYLREGLAVCDRHGFVSTKALILANLSDVATRAGDAAAAEAHARQALKLAEAARNRAVAAWVRLQLARLAIARGDLAAARGELAASLAIALAVGRPSLQLAAVACFAELLAAQGEADCARPLLSFAAEHAAAGAPQRAEIHARLAGLPAAGEALPWRGLELDELAHRIVAESSVAHAPLIGQLRGR